VTDARATAAVAALLGDESRAAMCLAMLDGGRWCVSDLAAEASVGMAAASEHVTRLVGGGLVTAETEGRHKYVRLASPDVARLLETLGALGEPERPRSLRAARERRRLATARSCYDHLAGRLGVAVHDAMLDRRLLHRRGGIGVTRKGWDWFADLDVDLDQGHGRRVFVGECVDLTERRPHLAGHVGAVLLDVFAREGWVRRPDRTRALVLTPSGEHAVHDRLGIGPADLTV